MNYVRPTIPYTELPEAAPNDDLAAEWNTYRKLLPQWLAEGHEGKTVLLKGEEVVGIYETEEAAEVEGLRRFLRTRS